MIKVDLLPKEIHEEKAKQQIKVVAIAAGTVIAAALIGHYALQWNKSNRLDREIADAQVELQKYEAIDAEVKAYQQQESQLSSRFNVIQELLKGTLAYPKFFEDFMALLPNDIWVGSLSTTTDPSYGLSVTVNAQSLTSFAIADWLTNLQSSPLCSDVRLGAISVADQGESGASVYSFTMNFTFRRREN